MAQAVQAWEAERQAARREEWPAVPQRLFTGLAFHVATWAEPSWVIAKVEANAQGTNRRFIVSNRRCPREGGPLGEGQPWTWRSLFIKVAAEVVTSSWRIVVRLFRQLAARLVSANL